MAMKLEVVITHDEATNKCSIEWSTASTKNVTEQEQQALSSMQKALLLQLGRPINTAIIH
ncbi:MULTISPECIES: hypothetical protein [Proteus]|uniref:Uncharacterized protein n=1 Tax=Proteus mirabilis TaxID=584 RepID=A0AAJ0Y9K5_PROMI|nr:MULTISPECIES: hypothetical protein [Proteus]ARX35379.1 hypothetical protein AM402_14845 [Proteus mirabilis]EIT1736867.1 hypothetical protein [Proteus mirabilis]EJD6316742.1 hypothetical protein [Proteus mirabilis]EJD6321023.1 hypothetical protein [Proteus mirabilis]EJD6440948.1 hypothetical protein [Proteus mirabilis]